MSITLQQILALTGKLDDTPGLETPRERFRRFIHDNVTNVGEVRDYIEECLRTSGDQYSRALQDLVNHVRHFWGFTEPLDAIKGFVDRSGLMDIGNPPQDSILSLKSKPVKPTPSGRLRSQIMWIR